MDQKEYGPAVGTLGLFARFLVASSLLLLSNLAPAASFRAVRTVAVGANPGAILTADLNRDSRPDLVVANNGGSTVSVMLGTASGSLGAVRNYTACFAPGFAVAVDLNEDAKVDLAVACGRGVGVLLGLGDGTFQAPSVYRVSPTGEALSGSGVGAADFTGDGHVDLLVTRPINDAIALLKGDGTGRFTLSRTYRQFTAPHEIAVDDFNIDGRPDFVVANHLSGTIAVHLGLGNADFQTREYQVGSGAGSVTAADLNDDGIQDLGVGYTFGAGIFLGNGDGSFQPVRAFAAATTTDVAAGDMNGDSIIDLALSTYNGLTILAGSGNGSFSLHSSYAAGSAAAACVAKDLNGDGRTDVAIANNKSNNVAIFLARPSGSFFAAIPYELGASPSSAAHGDFNHDGFRDAVVGANDGSFVLFLGRGDGTLRNATHIATGLPLGYPNKIVAADFNHDSKLDVAAVNEASTSVAVLLGNGEGGFESPVAYSGGNNSPSNLLTADFNQDSVADLAIPAYDSVNILLANGDGSFASPATYFSGAGIRSGDVADFNRDRIPDLVFANLDPYLSIFLGNGDGLFQPLRRRSLSGSPAEVRAAELTGDGKIDLVLTLPNQFAVARGNGDGTFQTPIAIPGNLSPLFMATSDFNDDRKADLIFTNDREVTLIQGKGDGTFSPAKRFPAGYTPAALTVGDFNGDRAPDVLVAPSHGTATVMLLNIAANTTKLSASPNPSSEGQQVTLVASVMPVIKDTPTPTGTVTFKDGTAILGSVSLSSGKATLRTTMLAAGTHSLRAHYSGDTNFNATASNTVSQQVSGSVRVSPGSLTFANQKVGTRSAPKNVTLTNSGTASFAITGIAITGTNYGSFAVASSNCGSSLAPGASCTIGVVFRPTAAAPRSAFLTITGSTNVLKVTLSGTGV